MKKFENFVHPLVRSIYTEENLKKHFPFLFEDFTNKQLYGDDEEIGL